MTDDEHAADWQPDLGAYAFENDPIPTLVRLRREDPVHWSRDGYWYLTRYEDIAAVLKDTKRFSSAGAGWGRSNSLGKPAAEGASAATDSVEQRASRSIARSFNQMDPPDHTRIRSLVQAAFSRRAVEDRRDVIVELIDELLDTASADGPFDLVADVAFHIPIIVACSIIGISTDQRSRFRTAFAASEALMAPKRSEESWAAALEASRWITGCLRDEIAARRAVPQRDLISDLIAAEETGERLTEGELLSAVSTIYTAAATTTERFISSGLYLLLSHPEQWQALVADRALMAGAIEEILRFHHPTQSTSTNRRCTVDVEIGGRIMRAGDTVRLGLGAANRDPAVIDDPDRFDIMRTPGINHLALGRGPHFCIGAPLVRYLGRLTFDRVMDRWPALTLVTRSPVKDPERPDRYREIIVAP